MSDLALSLLARVRVGFDEPLDAGLVPDGIVVVLGRWPLDAA